MRKLYVWGAGDIGRRVLYHLNDDWEVIFVDSNQRLSGSQFYGKRVIDVKEYLEKYFDKFILVAHLREHESVEMLKANNIINYFVHCDLPGEFNEPYARDNLKKYILCYLGNRSDYVLYGLSLYSIIIDTWLNKQYGIHPPILVQSDISIEFVDKIKSQYPELKLIDNIDGLKEINEVCICLCNYNELKGSSTLIKYCVTDIFDCTDKIKSYHNLVIEEFHNLHCGQRCFIVATGPSLRTEDLSLLKKNKQICISMNSIYFAFNETDWRPDYYVVSDYRGVDNCREFLDAFTAKAKFLGDNSNTFWKVPHGNDVICYHQHYEYCYNRKPKFSDDFSMRSYTGGTVTYTCLQLAVYMGFKQIYLLGVDFSYGGKDGNVMYGHFYREDKKEDMGIGYVKHVTLAYQAAKQYADAHGIKIYNATRGGKLEIFERVNFDDLF